MPPALKALVIESARYRPIIKNVLVRDPRLRSLKMEVLLAGDGMEGLLLFRSKAPDLVILELLLPKMSGFELVRAIRKEAAGGKEVPIVITSALARDMASLRVLEKHFDVHVLLKPFTPYDLAKTVQKVLQLARKGKSLRAGGRTGGISQRITSGAETVEDTPAPGQTQPLGREPSLVELDIGTVDITPSPEAQSVERQRDSIKRFMRGSLDETSLPMLLLDAHAQRLSGTLTLRVDKVRKVIYLLSGHPIYVQSNLRRETLGQMLVGKGRLSADQNSRALNVAREQRRPYGKTLVELGLLSDDEINDELLANTRSKLEASLSWRQGTWLFIQDHEVGNRVPHCVVEPVRLVFDGLKRRAPVEEALVRLTGREDCEFRLQPRFDTYRDQFVSTFGGRLAEVAEPGMNMGQVLVAMGSYPQEAVFQMYVLLECGLARLVEPQAAEQGQTEDPAERPLEPGDRLIISTPEPQEAADSAETIDSPAPPAVQIEQAAREAQQAAEPVHPPVAVPVRPPPGAASSSQELIETTDVPGLEPPGAPPQQMLETAEPVDHAPAFRPRPDSDARQAPVALPPEESLMARRLIKFTFNALKQRNYYDLLGVDPWCVKSAIADGYEKLHNKFAPENFARLELDEDLQQKLAAILEALEAARDVLLDTGARKAYNRTLGFSAEDGFDSQEH